MLDGDHFFYYGQVDEQKEIEADIIQLLTQDKRSMFYTRSYGAGVSDYENAPQGLALEIGLRYSIATSIAKRNYEVSNGNDGSRDRRAVTSQNAIFIDQTPDGIVVRVIYVPFFNYKTPGIVSVPIGG